MSQDKRNFSPQTREFSERQIQRISNEWPEALVTDFTRTPNGAVEELDNARSFGKEIRGRIGSLLHNRADYQVTVTGGLYEDALLSGGDIFDAKGEDPATGDIFITSNSTDYVFNVLEEAKKLKLNDQAVGESYDLPWGFDFYSIGSDIPMTPIYIGNLTIPPYRNYFARNTGVEDDFEVTKAGDIITRTIGTVDPFIEEMVGMYFYYGEESATPGVFDGKRDLITSFIDEDTITVSRMDIIDDGTYRLNRVQPIIHSSYYMQSNQRIYMHIGEEIYEVEIPIMNYKKLNGIINQKPLPAESILHEIKGDLILTNDNGHYRIKVGLGTFDSYYWKINSDRPFKSKNVIKKIFGFPTSTSSNAENGYVPAGFSGLRDDGTSDKLGGVILPFKTV